MTDQLEKILNYIRQHWRGELPLVTSFWFNVFLVNIGILILETNSVHFQAARTEFFANRFDSTFHRQASLRRASQLRRDSHQEMQQGMWSSSSAVSDALCGSCGPY